MTFTPDADPFSAGGCFAPPAAREGEPAVVVHAAPDAAVSRGARRARSSARAVADAADTHRDVLTLLRERDGAPDTGSLVRPYVTLTDLQPVQEPVPPADESGASAAERLAATRAIRRARRTPGRLERIIEITPPVPTSPRPVGEWHAPWTSEATPSDEVVPRSLFEPRASANAWAAPAASPLPSRKELRARERASAGGVDAGLDAGLDVASLAGVGRDQRVGSRRLAKSGVLAVTAVGVVAASAPNALSSLGWHLPSQHAGSTTQAALVGLAGAHAFPASDVSLGYSALLDAAGPSSVWQADNVAAARKDAAVLAKARADATAATAARAGAVASGAGRTLVDVAREQVAAEAARKATIAQQVSRNTVRDPRAYAQLLLQERGWGDQFTCLNLLWNRESGWNYQATNPSSGAYGIPQSLPGSKMASIAPDWRTNPATQIKWGLNYIAATYGTPCGAWGHSQAYGWY